MPVLDCSLCGERITAHDPRWVASDDTVCMDCVRTLVDDELNRRIDGQPSSLTLIRQECDQIADPLEELAQLGFTPIAKTLALRYGSGDTMLCAPTAVELITLWAKVRDVDRELAVDLSVAVTKNHPTGTNTDV